VRRFVLAAAPHLRALGALERDADVFDLDVHTLLGLLDGQLEPAAARAEAARNRALHESFRHFANPNELGDRYAGAVATAPAADAASVLRGVGCSAGVVTAPVRVIADIFDAHRLEPGDILVTRYTDPGWTPRFGQLAGVVTETGGILAHAAVISREYGIPAVLAVPGATRRLRDGDVVTLDGAAGTVSL
jgi:pyruvate,water dikinase